MSYKFKFTVSDYTLDAKERDEILTELEASGVKDVVILDDYTAKMGEIVLVDAIGKSWNSEQDEFIYGVLDKQDDILRFLYWMEDEPSGITAVSCERYRLHLAFNRALAINRKEKVSNGAG